MSVVHIATATFLLYLGSNLEYSKKADFVIYLMGITIAFLRIAYGAGQLYQGFYEGQDYYFDSLYDEKIQSWIVFLSILESIRYI